MNAASFDIKDMLAADSGLGLTYATNLFISHEPMKPGDCVTIYDTPGFPPEPTLDGGNWYYRSSVQIRVRNVKYSDAMALAINIMTLLHARAQEVWNGTLYTSILATGEPALLSYDENKRALVINNYNLQRR